jgi:hypothetical protein
VTRARRIRAVLVVPAVLASLAVAGCSSSGGSDGSSRSTSTTEPAAERTTSTTTKASDTDAPGLAFAHGWPKGSGGECDGHSPGEDGVLMTFCHGEAQVTVTATPGAAPRHLQGVCWIDAGSLEVDAGVTVGRGWKGAWPDYVTLRAAASTGPSGTIVAAWIDGTEHLLQDARGTVAAAGNGPGITVDEDMLATPGVALSFTAQDLARTPVKVDVSC